ncbi:SufE-like protein 2, chloroplastic [Sesamum alatum]|uniref:SufE-like protein 2, chloroplastic n=1 Tax=Sesamum alatum TaxID=300844 RepID=A0AAE2CIY9_9LAMI|nr:SufE-like protein 2, chloroplastic [Sesamum alatum]
MASTVPRSPLSRSSSFLFTKPVNTIESKYPSYIQRISAQNPPFLRFVFDPTSRKPIRQRFSLSCLTINQQPVVQIPSVSEKVQNLGFEFKSLAEPIDRVKRLLHYAALLPPFDESLRTQENRVFGCTAQVWLEVKMDGNGVMRFRADSDSEITKGFSSCLVWLLDGAEAEEVLSVKIDDLVEMNVGLPSRGKSRVNTWHNMLISMQRRTKDLVEERSRRKLQSLEAFSSLVAVIGSCKENQV